MSVICLTRSLIYLDILSAKYEPAWKCIKLVLKGLIYIPYAEIAK